MPWPKSCWPAFCSFDPLRQRLAAWTRSTGLVTGVRSRPAVGHGPGDQTNLVLAIPVVLAALAIAGYEIRHATSTLSRTRRPKSTLLIHAALMFLPALIIALPWYVRNAQLYGHLDFLARQWHNSVVVGQLRTGDFLAQAGLGGLLERMGVWSFDSFWGVFGWMGVWMDGRV